MLCLLCFSLAPHTLPWIQLTANVKILLSAFDFSYSKHLSFVGELSHACSLSSPKIIFASHGTLDKVQRVKDQSNFIKKLFVFGDEFGKSYGSFNVFIRNALVPSEEYYNCPPQNKMENVAIIFCSSGTTGVPKAVQLTQNNLWFSMSFLPMWVYDCYDRNSHV